MSKSSISKVWATVAASLYKDGHLAGSEAAGTVRDWHLTGSIVAERVAKRMAHGAKSLEIVARGMRETSERLNNQVAAIDLDIQEELDKDDEAWGRTGPDIDFGRLPEMVYIIEGSDDDVTTYYGPVDYERACTMVNSIKGNVDVTRGVPAEALPIEVLLEKQSAQLRKKLSK